MQLGIGIIGAWGPSETQYGKLTAQCDVNPQVRESVHKKYPDVAVYEDYRDLAADANVDLVYIVTPNRVHAEQAIACLEAGKHVFLEKPMVVRREEAAPLLEAEAGGDATLVVDFEMRYSLLTGRRLREIIDAGEIGRPVGMTVEHYRGAWIEEGSGIWRTRPEESGGLFFMEICHNLDLMRSVLGEAVEVQTFKMQNVLPHYRIPDNVQTHIFFEGGAMGNITSSHTRSGNARKDYDDWERAGHHDQMTIVGTDGSLVLDVWKKHLAVFRFEEYPVGSGGSRVRLVRGEDYSNIGFNELTHNMRGYLEDFIRRMAVGEPPLQTAEDAWRTHAVCLACEQSALTDGFPRMEVDYSPLS